MATNSIQEIDDAALNYEAGRSVFHFAASNVSGPVWDGQVGKGGIFLAKLPTLPKVPYFIITLPPYLIDKRPWQGQMTYIIFIGITLAKVVGRPTEEAGHVYEGCDIKFC